MRKNADNRKDAIIKKEIFDSETKHNYFIELVLDGRKQIANMWRKDLQLPFIQVCHGDF